VKNVHRERNDIFNMPTKCTRIFEYIYIYIYFIKSLLHVSAHSAQSSGRKLVTCSNLFAYFNVVTRVTKREICNMCVLQSYLQLFEFNNFK